MCVFELKFCPDICIEVGFLDHIAIFLACWGNPILFFTVAASIYIPTNSNAIFISVATSCWIIHGHILPKGTNHLYDHVHLSYTHLVYGIFLIFVLWFYGFIIFPFIVGKQNLKDLQTLMIVKSKKDKRKQIDKLH